VPASPKTHLVGGEAYERIRTVELTLIARLIALGPQKDSPRTVRQLMKVARAAGFERGSGCPRHPEIVHLYARRPNGPVTAMVNAYVTAERKVATLNARSNPVLACRDQGPERDTRRIAHLLAWPTRESAAQLIEGYAAGRETR